MKKKLLFSLLVSITFFTTKAQIQIGSDIDGENEGDRSGRSVSINSDGTIVAIGANLNGTNNSHTGHVRVFENINNTWTQIGQDIDGDNAGDESGTSISLNDSGTIVAIGARFVDPTLTGQVRVFENTNNTWTQIGQDINGEEILSLFGTSVDLNASGAIIAIGAVGVSDSTGQVRVFENINNTWTQIGQDIDGENTSDQFGFSVNLNDDGNIVAIGSPFNDTNGESSGQVRIFENINDSWVQIGQSIIGEADQDNSGISIHMNSDGTIIAVGATFNNNVNGFTGHVRVYENTNNTWTQIGQDIDGDADDELFGTSVSLNDNGTILAVGATFSDSPNGEDTGQVKIYKRQNNNWIQIGNNIDGEAALNFFGGAVSLSSSGDTVAIGATFNDGDTGVDSGHVRVFDLSNVLNIEDVLSDNDILLYPNPASNHIIIKNTPIPILKELTLTDIHGRYLENHKVTTTISDIQIDLNNYSSGIYFIHIQTENSSITKRIIKK